MATRIALWRVDGDSPLPVPVTRLNLESRLEDWIARDSSILGIDVLIVGRQIVTTFGGRIDLLALNRDGDVIIIELKRDKTPREVIAQTLDYASWVKTLTPKEIHERASEYLPEGLDAAFANRFQIGLPDSVNTKHSMLVVGSELDDSSERIVTYLVEEYGVNINAVFFSFFSDGSSEYLGRSWLASPENVSQTSSGKRDAPWTGYWYANVDEGDSRSWDDCRKYGFLSAGGGRKYTDPLGRLEVGSKVLAYQKGSGYVGYGVVGSEAMMARDFIVGPEAKNLLELHLTQPNLAHDRDNPELAEWVVGVRWVKAVPREQAKRFAGIFANQNVVCKLRDEKTFNFVRTEFAISDDEE